MFIILSATKNIASEYLHYLFSCYFTYLFHIFLVFLSLHLTTSQFWCIPLLVMRRDMYLLPPLPSQLCSLKQTTLPDGVLLATKILQRFRQYLAEFRGYITLLGQDFDRQHVRLSLHGQDYGRQHDCFYHYMAKILAVNVNIDYYVANILTVNITNGTLNLRALLIGLLPISPIFSGSTNWQETDKRVVTNENNILFINNKVSYKLMHVSMQYFAYYKNQTHI